jgi:vacuolar-type H+-ATPase subunit I/STV1
MECEYCGSEYGNDDARLNRKQVDIVYDATKGISRIIADAVLSAAEDAVKSQAVIKELEDKGFVAEQIPKLISDLMADSNELKSLKSELQQKIAEAKKQIEFANGAMTTFQKLRDLCNQKGLFDGVAAIDSYILEFQAGPKTEHGCNLISWEISHY